MPVRAPGRAPASRARSSSETVPRTRREDPCDVRTMRMRAGAGLTLTSTRRMIATRVMPGTNNGRISPDASLRKRRCDPLCQTCREPAETRRENDHEAHPGDRAVLHHRRTARGDRRGRQAAGGAGVAGYRDLFLARHARRHGRDDGRHDGRRRWRRHAAVGPARRQVEGQPVRPNAFRRQRQFPRRHLAQQPQPGARRGDAGRARGEQARAGACS